MRLRFLLLLLGIALVILGAIYGAWCWFLVWPGVDFLILGTAHVVGGNHVFGKRTDGTLPLWSWLVFGPVHGYTLLVWHVIRVASREPAFNQVTNNLFVGRRLLPTEVPGDFANYVDLTAELTEPAEVRRLSAYRNFPILDGSAPSPRALQTMMASLPPGKTYVHCAQGHGRTGLFSLAWLLHTRAAQSVEDGMGQLRKARPAVRLSCEQQDCLEQYARLISSKHHDQD